MTAIILLAIALAMIVWTIALVRHDGMGPTRPPASHFEDPRFRSPMA
ncbi:hypothetical protein [Nocardioides sp.]